VTRTRDIARDGRRRATLDQVTAALTAAIPALNADLAVMLLESVRATGRGTGPNHLEELAGYLAAHVDGLTSGDPRCPAVLVRLTHALHDAGHTGVGRPGCAECGKITPLLNRSGPGGRICGNCATRSHRSTCDRCGRTDTRIAARPAMQPALVTERELGREVAQQDPKLSTAKGTKASCRSGGMKEGLVGVGIQLIGCGDLNPSTGGMVPSTLPSAHMLRGTANWPMPIDSFARWCYKGNS
jgi:hypothetical protein